MPNCAAGTGTLGRDQRIQWARDGVNVVFARDARGRDSVCVTGEGLTDEQLRAIGDEIAGRTVQHYVLAKLKSEMAGKGMDLVEETVEENQSIRLRVRHWQN